jgi:hypothetical protein
MRNSVINRTCLLLITYFLAELLLVAILVSLLDKHIMVQL